MFIKQLKAKIHRVRVTKVDVDYEGSISIDRDLIEAAGLKPFEAVCIWNVTNGARLETYVIEAPAGSGEIGLNGAAARLALTGDIIIIAAFCWLHEDEKREPVVVLVDEANKVKKP
jgi:aspartate 1-decarboxylase